MQFGILTVGDVTTDPTTGRTPTAHERIKAQVAIAKKAEEVGLDVVAAEDRGGDGALRRRRARLRDAAARLRLSRRWRRSAAGP